ncbi:MAG: hypothetical protein LBC95_01150 [Candidatus Nomurabacteria bacterium]|jgi:hypothetical protein|nr:hypothetical protein [Candidatus Nomurabacteria bacterium]
MKNVFVVKSAKITGSTYLDIERKARNSYQNIARRTKRTPYVRSTYWRKDKVFLSLFWTHLNQKYRSERKRRLKYFDCGVELLRHSTIEPETRDNPNGSNELVHRFTGQTMGGQVFWVQVKENKRTGAKYLMSIFSKDK